MQDSVRRDPSHSMRCPEIGYACTQIGRP
eukprot:COSAG03_NODE_14053_length_478_cov_1.575198_1_plen_28_part_10